MAESIIRDLNKEQNATFQRLLQTIRTKERRNKLRLEYLEQKKRLDNIGFSIPPHMQDFAAVLGWANKAVTVPARRVRPEGFHLARPSELLSRVEEIMAEEYVASLENQTVEAAGALSVGFMFVSPGDIAAGEPEVIFSARTATEATCEVDYRTNKTTAALEVLSRREFLLYLPGETFRIELDQGIYKATARYAGIAGRVMCTPYVWRRTLTRGFGYSRISRALMDFTDMGVRTMLRQEVNAEFYGAPQRVLLGAEESHFRNSKGERISPLQALIGGVWALPDTRDDETGDLVRPKLEQLQQATMQPHGEMLRDIAMQVSSETSIPVNYLGIIHDNPSSADAIRASESDLVSVVEAELPSIGAARTNVARDVAAILEGQWTVGMERELRGLKSYFRDPGISTKSEQADAGLKYTQTFPLGDPEVAMERYGLTRPEIERNLKYMKQQAAVQTVMEALRAQPQQVAAGASRQPAIQGTVEQ